MRNLINAIRSKLKKQNEQVSCGNCWGHQEYNNGYEAKVMDLSRDRKDNFISKFVKMYLS